MAYTILITLVLMNLVIAILSDAYELVTSEKKYYDGKAKIRRSLMYEKLRQFILKPFAGEKEQTYRYLFVSMALNFEDDIDNEQEGMIGKILNLNRKHHKEAQRYNEKKFDEHSVKIEKNQMKID